MGNEKTHPTLEGCEDRWDVYDLDGFSWVDLLDWLCVPHYTNSNRGAQPPVSIDIRTLKSVNDDVIDGQYMVMWQEGGPRPTDEQVITWLEKQYSESEEDDDEDDG